MLPRLYAILDVDLAGRRGLDPVQLVDVWLEAGVSLIQLRAKSLPGGPFLDLAIAIRRSTRGKAAFIVNDRADVASASGADGVHVGQDDLSPADARRLLGPSATVGVSSHTENQVLEAIRQEVTYVAIGPVFCTASKERPDPVVGIEGVRRAVELAAGLPVVAIGGITLDRAPEVIAAGASSVAVIADLVVGDPLDRARRFLDVTR